MYKRWQIGIHLIHCDKKHGNREIIKLCVYFSLFSNHLMDIPLN